MRDEYEQAWADGRTRASYEGWLETEIERLKAENERLRHRPAFDETEAKP